MDLTIINKRWYFNIACAILIVNFSTIGFGHSVPLFSLLMDHYGASKTMIGLNAAVSAFALVLAPFMYPKLMARFGMRLFYLGCISLMIISYMGFYLAGEKLWLWFPLRFFFSFGASGLFIGSEY